MCLSKSEIRFFWKKSNFQKIKFENQIFEKISMKTKGPNFGIIFLDKMQSQ